MIFVYTDHSKQVYNPKLHLWPHSQIMACIEAEDIVSADKEFTGKTGIVPAKLPHIGCMVLTALQLAEHLTYVYNAAENDRIARQDNQRNLRIQVHFLECPWLLPRPEYEI